MKCIKIIEQFVKGVKFEALIYLPCDTHMFVDYSFVRTYLIPNLSKIALVVGFVWLVGWWQSMVNGSNKCLKMVIQSYEHFTEGYELDKV